MDMVDIEYVTGDIVSLEVEAVVNATDSQCSGDGGVDQAIHVAAGREVLRKACQDVLRSGYPNGLPVGEAFITDGFNLPARYIIHTVGPVWKGGDQGESELLANAYINSLKLAVHHGIREIAFSAISTGVFGYPKDKAEKVAREAVQSFLQENKSSPDRVIFVTYG